VSEALSGPRIEILNLVATAPVGVKMIAKTLGISPTAARFHLHKLLALGLLEEVEERGPVGRPRILYAATGKRVEMGFPMRNYIQLSEVLIRTLLASPNQKQMEEQLRKAGRAYASYMAGDLMRRAPDAKWDAKTFRKYVVEEALKGWGAQPELTVASRDSLRYRCYNCLFRELAQKYPRMICGVLDDELHREFCKELNPAIDWKKLKCIGDGDRYCEYLLTWAPQESP